MGEWQIALYTRSLGHLAVPCQLRLVCREPYGDNTNLSHQEVKEDIVLTVNKGSCAPGDGGRVAVNRADS